MRRLLSDDETVVVEVVVGESEAVCVGWMMLGATGARVDVDDGR